MADKPRGRPPLDDEADRFERYVLHDYAVDSADHAAMDEHPDGVTLLIGIYRTGDEKTRRFLAAITGFQ